MPRADIREGQGLHRRAARRLAMSHRSGRCFPPLALGLDLETVIACTTSNPAGTLWLEESIGSLKVGKAADISILRQVEGEWSFIDSHGQTLRGDTTLVPSGAVRGGEYVESAPSTFLAQQSKAASRILVSRLRSSLHYSALLCERMKMDSRFRGNDERRLTASLFYSMNFKDRTLADSMVRVSPSGVWWPVFSPRPRLPPIRQEPYGHV